MEWVLNFVKCFFCIHWFFSFLLLMWCITLIHLHMYNHPCGEGNGTPLQCSCLENPMDGGAW